MNGKVAREIPDLGCGQKTIASHNEFDARQDREMLGAA
jgi:hypothetical protein